ncbi:hypothetical protein EVAR_40709_1 [Eumeta japonica]|uniref:Uncharacterized protein n=1 Tax=Eumeta variegata TaxID=151549 RepID=A0A4C1X833_EUMVA|nr:hypothetical protein EVAR_40709_1 [Eumeta japonica]
MKRGGGSSINNRRRQKSESAGFERDHERIVFDFLTYDRLNDSPVCLGGDLMSWCRKPSSHPPNPSRFRFPLWPITKWSRVSELSADGARAGNRRRRV